MKRDIWEEECYIKVHRYMNEIVVAICDANLLGKTISYGRIKLEISKKFYGGSKVKLKEVLRFIEEATIINAVGKNVVTLLTQLYSNIEDAILWIGDVPHVQIVK